MEHSWNTESNVSLWHWSFKELSCSQGMQWLIFFLYVTTTWALHIGHYLILNTDLIPLTQPVPLAVTEGIRLDLNIKWMWIIGKCGTAFKINRTLLYQRLVQMRKSKIAIGFQGSCSYPKEVQVFHCSFKVLLRTDKDVLFHFILS